MSVTQIADAAFIVLVMRDDVKDKIKINKTKDIIELLKCTEVEERIYKNIIKDLEKTAAEGIVNKDAVAIPYIGTFRKSIYTKIKKDKRVLLRLAKQQMDLNDYKQYRRELYIDIEKEVKEHKKAEYIVHKLIRMNKDKYNILYTNFGKVYADTWIKFIATIKVLNSKRDIDFI